MKKMAIVKMATMLVLSGCGGADDGASDGLPRGVTADSIKVGSHTDLSGNLAIWGVPATNGQRMRFDEANAAGGIHGRMIDFIVEDSQYQMPNAVKATNKLLNVDNIFLMVGAMGTPMNIAVMPRMFEADVPNFFPISRHSIKMAYSHSLNLRHEDCSSIKSNSFRW